MSVLEYDPHIRFLAEANINNINVIKDKVVSEITRFSNDISYKWLTKFIKDAEKSLAIVMITILRYCDHSDPIVRNSAYNALGTLCISIAPFVPQEFTAAFNLATCNLPVTPKISCAVINMFVYLTRFVSPVRITEFVSKCQVLPHFGADMTENLQYLTKIIPLMDKLPIEFHQNIMRSLIFKCARTPTTHFASSVCSLVNFNIPILLDILVTMLCENNLATASVWIGPSLLENKEVFDQLSEKGREFFLSSALSELKKEQLTLDTFEYGCQISALFLKYTKNTPEYEQIHKRIYEALDRELQPVYKIRVYILPTPFEQLQIDEKDNDRLKEAKIKAIAEYFNEDDCTADADAVAEIFLKHKTSENDLYCTLVESYAKCVRKFFNNCKKRFHLQLLEYILKKKNSNWVHNEAVTKVIDALDPTKVPRYVDLALSRLIEFTLDDNVRLMKAAVHSLIRFSSYQNLDAILQKLIWSDWIDEQCCKRRFYLLAQLAKRFKTPLFDQFVDIAFESVLFFSNDELLSNLFNFLSLVNIKYIPTAVRDAAFSYVVTNFQHFSRVTMEGPIRKYSKSYPDTHFLDGVSRDIVTNPTLNHRHCLMSIKHAYSFLCALDVSLVGDIDALFWVSLALIPVFDRFAIEKAIQIFQIRPSNFAPLWKLNTEILSSTSNDDVAIQCLSLVIRSGRKPPEAASHIAESILTNALTNNADLLFYCFVIVDQDNHDLAVSSIEKNIPNLSKLDANAFLFNLLHVAGKVVMPMITKENDIALVEYASLQPDVYGPRVSAYLDENDFCDWNVREPSLVKAMVSFIENSGKKYVIRDLEKLDVYHWKFIFVYSQLFDFTNIIEYIHKNPRRFSKFDIPYTKIEESKPEFKLSEIKALHLASAAPIFYGGKFIKDMGYIKSFFGNATKPVSDEVFRKAFEYCEANFSVPAINTVLDFATRVHQPMDIGLLSRHMILLTDRVFPHFIKCFTSDGFIDGLSEQIKQKIERKIGATIEPSLILKASNPNIATLISADPKYFFKYFDTEPDYKSKQLLSVIENIDSSLLPPNLLKDLTIRLLMSMGDMQTTKKRGTFVRFLAAELTLQTKENRIMLSELINDHFSDLVNYITDGSIKDFAIVVNQIARCASNMKNVSNFLTSLPQNGSEILLFADVVAIAGARGATLPMLTPEFYEFVLKTPLPSNITKCLRAFKVLSDPRLRPQALQLVTKNLRFVENQFEYVTKNFLCGEVFCKELLGTLLQHPLSNTVPPVFIEKVRVEIIDKPWLAVFDSALSFITPMTFRYPNLGQMMFLLQHDSEAVLDAAEESYQTGLSMMNSEQMARGYMMETLRIVTNRFAMFPTARLGRFILQLLQTLRESVDAPKFLFGSFKSDFQNFLTLFSVLGVFLMRATREEVERCGSTIQENRDGYQLMSRSHAMMLMCAGARENLGMAFEIAASERDDIEVVTQEFESFQ